MTTDTAPSVSPSTATTTASAPEELDAAKWDITDAMTQQLVQRWAEATTDVTPETAHVPLLVLLGEAVTLASFVEQYLAPVNARGVKLPGLESVLGTGVISDKTHEELRELAMALGAVRAQIDRNLQSSDRTSVEEAEVVLGELKATLRFVLDGEDDKGEQQLDQLVELYGTADRFDEVAMALQAFADLADEHAAKLAKVSHFAANLPARARGLAFALRERKAAQLASAEARALTIDKDVRDRLTGALLARMRAARKAFRFVFRDHPDIVRKVTSAYERDRRRSRERSAAQTEDDAPSIDVTEITSAVGG